MGLGLTTAFARRAPVKAYACIGPGALPAAEAALRSPALRRAASPREASVLLVAGEPPNDDAAGFDRIHDQVPKPRAVYRWDCTGDPAAALVGLRDGLLDGERGDPDRLPDTPPNPWRGLGAHGQGGKGMMGGTPYGRPMAMTDADIRDGLNLDAYACRIGPFASMLPPGLTLDLVLQGDVIVSAEVASAPYEQPAEADAPAACAARLLRLIGLTRAAEQAASQTKVRAPFATTAIPRGLAETPDGGDVRLRLRRWLDGSRADQAAPSLRSMLPGLEWCEAVLALNSFAPSRLRSSALEAAS